jgi:DNA polymerase-1
MADKFLILDSNSILYRAFFALPKLTTKKGEIVNGVYGFLLLFFKLIKELKPDFVGACFDFPAPTFRHEKFKEYKAKRPPTPKELSLQIPILKEVLESFHIQIFEKEGFEADDLIGTLIHLAPKEIEKIIVTGDFDTLQLVSKNVKVYFLQKGVKKSLIFDEKKVREKYGGLSPCQIPDFKALVGDPSDNIIGIEGIGPKTAISLLLKHKNLKEILKKAEKLNFPQREKFLENKEKILLNLKLATIKKDVNLPFDIEKLKFKDYNEKEVEKVFRKLGFKSLIKRLKELKPEDSNLKLF